MYSIFKKIVLINTFFNKLTDIINFHVTIYDKKKKKGYLFDKECPGLVNLWSGNLMEVYIPTAIDVEYSHTVNPPCAYISKKNK